MKNFIDGIKYYLTSAVAIAGAIFALLAYVQLDTTAFETTTELAVVSTGGQVYVQWDIDVPLDASAKLTYYFDDHQVAHYHFDTINRDEWIDQIPLPVGVEDFEFIAEWKITSWHQSEKVLFIVEVE